MTNYEMIKGLRVNDTDESKVMELVNSMLVNGWLGSPVLYCENGLVTGSHRVAALEVIEQMFLNDEIAAEQAQVLEQVEILDVTEEINTYCENEGYSFDDIDFSSLGYVFEGTRVEQYASQIAEW